MDTTMDIRLNELILLQTDIEPKRLQPSSSFSSPSRVFSVQCHVPIKHENCSATSSDTAPLLPRSRAASHEGNEDHQCAIPISNAAITTTSNKAFSSADRKEKEASSEMSSSDTDEDGKKSTKINEDGTIRVPSGSGYRVMTPFPWRLHEILEEVEQMKLDWIVSWLPNGRGFQVHCQNNFSEIIIPMFFRHCRYKSFQRQLYLYGFRSLDAQTMTRGAYFHPKFVRNDRSLCRDIVRVKIETAQRSKKDRKRTKQAAAGAEEKMQGDSPPAQPQPWVLQQLQFSSTNRHLVPERALPSLPAIQDDNFGSLFPFAEFSDQLLQFSEDIICLFGFPSI